MKKYIHSPFFSFKMHIAIALQIFKCFYNHLGEKKNELICQIKTKKMLKENSRITPSETYNMEESNRLTMLRIIKAEQNKVAKG